MRYVNYSFESANIINLDRTDYSFRSSLIWIYVVWDGLSVQILRVYMGLVATKPVFGVSDKTRLKPVSSATGAPEISLKTSLDMVLFKTRIIKALIRLRGCAGWSAPVLFANPRRQIFSPYVRHSISVKRRVRTFILGGNIMNH